MNKEDAHIVIAMANHNILYYYQYNGNTVEYCVEIVKQEAADGQGEAADRVRPSTVL